MTVSIVKLYEKLGVNPERGTLIPIVGNLEGQLPAESYINMALGTILHAFLKAERENMLCSIYEDEKADSGWLEVKIAYTLNQYVEDEDEVFTEGMEYGIAKVQELGYIDLQIWESVRYFKPLKKCLDLELYAPPKYLPDGLDNP